MFLFTSISRSQSVDTALATFSNTTHYEKAYVHFDNHRYTPGQTIWYKAYLMDGLQPSLNSKNFYIDWIDDSGQLMKSTVTPVIYSFSSGSFTIPETYHGKFIRAIAYTRWMRNFDSLYFYEQTFEINSSSSNIEKKDFGLRESKAQFLPESGALLSNKLNVIAFKAVNNSGKPEAISGMIKNSRGDSILSFKSIHNGMGKFQFKPEVGERYTAIWTDVSGTKHKSDLPAPEESAVNLLLEPGRSNRIFHIQRTQSVPDRSKKLTLIGQMNGKVLFKAPINLADKESFTGSLPTNKILSGILQLTVFDANSQPLCERLIFVKNDDYLLNATIQIDTLNTKKRGRNVLEIILNDTTYANLSISVTDADLNNHQDNNIISQLLLKGDLTGAVYKPDYYFASDADSVLNQLDLVMLTNGWRRYNWQKILLNPIPVLKYAKDSGYQSVYGRIANYKPKKSGKTDSINLIFVARDSSNMKISLPILEDGSFSAKNAMLFDTTKVFYKINGSTGTSQKDLFIRNDLFRPGTAIIPHPLQYDMDTAGISRFQFLAEKQITGANRYRSLKEVTVYSKQASRLKDLEVKYTKGIFSGEAAAAFDMNTLENAGHRASIFDFLTGKVPGLEVGNTLGGTATEGVVEYRRGAATFYLDETAIQTSELANINLDNVAYIKVFNPPFVGGFNESGGEIASGGAIAIYTRNGVDVKSRENTFVSNGMEYRLLSGYAPNKEFYSPDYAEKTLPGTPEDFRSTLLWKPWISIDKTNKIIKIVFYNNDITNSFRIVLEGMDGEGKLVHISRLLN